MLVPLWNALPSKVVLAADLENFRESLSNVLVSITTLTICNTWRLQTFVQQWTP